MPQEALRRSEEHLRQSQKMEAIGRLAGGIAHDFNNLLTAIIGYSALLLDTLAGNEEALEQVQEIRTAGERAAALTSQLLAFSRRQVLQPKVIDLNLIVADFDRMLRRTVGERIQVEIDCAPDLWQVRADPGEIGRAIMNLSLNARDAMPGDGTLTIQTANLTLSEAEAREQDVPPGRYVIVGGARHRAWAWTPRRRSTSSSRSSPPRKPGREPAWVWPRCWASWSKVAASSGAAPSWERARVSGSCCRRLPTRSERV